MDQDNHVVLSGTAEPRFGNFSVESGDSLHSVSMKAYGTSTTATRGKIARANGIGPATQLTPGQKLVIPV